eukprot:CAMPEP_0182852630 /NCGR_PEP_ID=MMETSP0034_2-20130328/270_1 /TAXON_ID=156128 /ORGANISM="Nephroselmis pyriformis, Strain CCMP717" /LENGTH=55 /DNA_ID=CAMNT_0024983355 /DNA_START=207 /DNA_END=371 /DNA_ORIENTATION=+
MSPRQAGEKYRVGEEATQTGEAEGREDGVLLSHLPTREAAAPPGAAEAPPAPPPR